MPQAHRTLRHPFVAGVHITDLETEKEISAHTEDISPFGCFIETITPFAADTRVKLRITRSGQHMVAHAKVAYSRPKAGMGVVFLSFESGNLDTLDPWLEDLRK